MEKAAAWATWYRNCRGVARREWEIPTRLRSSRDEMGKKVSGFARPRSSHDLARNLRLCRGQTWTMLRHQRDRRELVGVQGVHELGVGEDGGHVGVALCVWEVPAKMWEVPAKMWEVPAISTGCQ